MSVPALPEDDELARELAHQLAHLDALEERQERALSAEAEAELVEVSDSAVQPLWPPGVPEPPPPGSGGSSLDPYLAWLDVARGLLDVRVAANHAELDRLRSQWTHVVRNLDRLRPEEVASVHDGQVVLRERIASDAALHHLLCTERERVARWGDALGGPLLDPSLVRRLLDDVVAERSMLAAGVVTAAIDALSRVSLDLDVAQRHIERDPSAAAQDLAAIRERMAAVCEELRDLPGAVDIRQLAGEPLRLTLQRCVEQHRHWLDAELEWNGGEVHDAETAAAIPWVLQECLHYLARGERQGVRVIVDAGPEDAVALRIAIASVALLPDGDPGWLVRSRARVAMASGRLLCGRAGTGSFVEARFGADWGTATSRS